MSRLSRSSTSTVQNYASGFSSFQTKVSIFEVFSVQLQLFLCSNITVLFLGTSVLHSSTFVSTELKKNQYFPLFLSLLMLESSMGRV